ncbi:MAG: zinc-ribbon domain-containing protein [Deltaproteobacteria bacterium]|nr:zinc-ribbon domain-containing protein [Deltaproteobacteria bacterium]MBW1919671.1 zinc-ribbon domain-containing protein [Deltaproteobacteria bacterium]
MIIECKNCGSKFRLDEGLLKKSGSKVRCSVCNNVFLAYPPGMESAEETDQFLLGQDMIETEAIGPTPPFAKKKEAEEAIEEDFGKAFEEAMKTKPAPPVPGEGVSEKGKSGKEEEPEVKPEEKKKERKAKKAKKEKEEKEVLAEAPEEKKAGRVRVLPIVLVIILIILGGAVAIYVYAPGLIPNSLSFLKPTKTSEIGDLGVRRLSFKGVSGSFVQSETAGQLFAIKGIVTNNYPKSRSFILLKGTILDDKGQVVRTKLAYAGNVFSEKQLKQMSVDRINQAMKNRFGKGRINVNVRPQGSIPFMIVFENLPENLSEFTVEAVSSSPGK